MSEPLVITERLGGSALSRAGQAGELPEWYGPPLRTPDDWRQRVQTVRATARREWLRELEPALSPSGVARDRLMRAAGSGVVVTTGQQPGPFGGPLMTLAKALTARALADALERASGVPVAPVFWAATDDADFEEAAVVSVALDGGAHELRCESTAPVGTPMSRVPLRLRGDALELFTAACGSLAGRPYYEAALESYCQETTIGAAYVALLRTVLEPLGIAVLDAAHPCVTSAGAALLGAAASRAESLADAVRARSDEIVAAGYSPQVVEVPGLSLVFVNRDGTKRRLTVEEAREHRGAITHDLSATVLLRPVLERAILPTAAYVGGPGEIAYFAQVGAVAAALDVPAPLVVPRWSTTVIEPRVERILKKLGIQPADLADPHAVESRVARARIEPGTVAALRALRSQLDSGVDALAAAADAGTPAPVFDGFRRSIEHRIARLERRVLAGVKRREAETMRIIATARAALYPDGTRQERKLAYAALLARYGAPLVEQLLDGARAHAQALVARESTVGLPALAVPERAS